MAKTNTNALNVLTPHVVIASPKGVAISFFMGLLRRPAKRGTPRNDKLLIAFVLVQAWIDLGLLAIEIPKRVRNDSFTVICHPELVSGSHPMDKPRC